MLTENARTVEAADALEKGDLQRMGVLMAESHASMRDDFEITVPQIDTLVEIVKATIGDKGGVRMTGGGFGGYVVAGAGNAGSGGERGGGASVRSKTGIKETFYVCKPSQEQDSAKRILCGGPRWAALSSDHPAQSRGDGGDTDGLGRNAIIRAFLYRMARCARRCSVARRQSTTFSRRRFSAHPWGVTLTALRKAALNWVDELTRWRQAKITRRPGRF